MDEKRRGESTVWSAGLHTNSWNDGHAGTPLKQPACDSMSLLHCMCSKTNRLPAHTLHGVGWTAAAVYWYGTGSSGVWSLAHRDWTGFHYVNVICHTVFCFTPQSPWVSTVSVGWRRFLVMFASFADLSDAESPKYPLGHLSWTLMRYFLFSKIQLDFWSHLKSLKHVESDLWSAFRFTWWEKAVNVF